MQNNNNNENKLINEIQQLVIDNLNKEDINDNNDFVFGEKILIPENFDGKIPNYTYQKQNELRKFRERVIQKKKKGRELNENEQKK